MVLAFFVFVGLLLANVATEINMQQSMVKLPIEMKEILRIMGVVV
jgi:hypothetical protein